MEEFGDWLDIENKEEKLITTIVIPWESEYEGKPFFFKKKLLGLF